MYQCVMCKKSQYGQPALVNGVGSFCPACEKEIRKRQLDAQAEKREKYDGMCKWCGKEVNFKNPPVDQNGNRNIHAKCATHRDWMLESIRYSDKLYKYVVRTEEKEAPDRKKREQTYIVNNCQDHKIDNDRIKALEDIVLSLLEKLNTTCSKEQNNG